MINLTYSIGGFDNFLSPVARKSRSKSVERDSHSATKNAYPLCLNRRYLIHFQYSVGGFVELVGQKE